jgi:hypothetical protein
MASTIQLDTYLCFYALSSERKALLRFCASFYSVGYRRFHLVAPATRRRRYFSFLAQATPLPYRPHTSFRASPEHSRSVGSRTAQECGRHIVGTYTPRPFRLSLPRPSHRAQF